MRSTALPGVHARLHTIGYYRGDINGDDVRDPSRSVAQRVHSPADMRLSSAFVVVLAGLGVWVSVQAATPTAADFASCNAAARDAVKAGSASPNTASPTPKDQGRAASARQGNQPTDATGKITESRDPQLEGMDAEGAKDPLYQAAYRTCMRKAGF